jgi:leucyl aminopeptidase
MGGAALVLGVAHVLMSLQLPVRLRVLVPAVENSVSGNAIRPLDVLPSRKGLTVEIGNTDAEGRLILADALTEASSESPDLMIDAATLTGAARVALGTALPALFSTNDAAADALLEAGRGSGDPMWRLPLHDAYRRALDSKVADLNNVSADSYAGAITAALFLREFITPKQAWLHIDTMGWNVESRPGRPYGGEALGLRALVDMLVARYSR